MSETNFCAKCKEDKPATTEYFPSRGVYGFEGLRSICLMCYKDKPKAIETLKPVPDVEFFQDEKDDMPRPPNKACSDCDEKHPPNVKWFHHQSNKEDGITDRCRDCALLHRSLFTEGQVRTVVWIGELLGRGFEPTMDVHIKEEDLQSLVYRRLVVLGSQVFSMPLNKDIFLTETGAVCFQEWRAEV